MSTANEKLVQFFIERFNMDNFDLKGITIDEESNDGYVDAVKLVLDGKVKLTTKKKPKFSEKHLLNRLQVKPVEKKIKPANSKEDKIKMMFDFAGLDDTRTYINSVLIEPECLVATDGKRLFSVELKSDNTHNILVDKNNELSDASKFPDWRKIIPVATKQPLQISSILFSEYLRGALKLYRMTNSQFNTIRLNFEGDKTHFYANIKYLITMIEAFEKLRYPLINIQIPNQMDKGVLFVTSPDNKVQHILAEVNMGYMDREKANSLCLFNANMKDFADNYLESKTKETKVKSNDITNFFGVH